MHLGHGAESGAVVVHHSSWLSAVRRGRQGAICGALEVDGGMRQDEFSSLGTTRTAGTVLYR